MSTLTAQPARRPESMSRADVAWLHADLPTNHFVVTSLALFDEPLDVTHFKAMLARRISLHPRLAQVIGQPSYPFGPDRWMAAANFDLDAHVRRVALPAPGGARELQEYIGDLVGRPLDFGRPLWESHVVDGPGTGGALVTRFHHSLGDGQAMTRMLLSLTDATESGWRKPPRRTRKASRSAAPYGARSMNPVTLLRTGLDAAGTLARLTLMEEDQPTSLRGGLSLIKQVAWTPPLPLDEVKRVAHQTGTTVNDVLVSVIAGAVGAGLRREGMATRGVRLRAMVPVNLRPPDDTGMTGNRFSLVFLELPVGVTDAHERLMRVKIEMDRIKGSLEPAVGWLLVQGLGLLPPRLEQSVSSFYADKASVVLTNVVGPERPLYLAGTPIRQMTFWEPESGGLGVGLSIFSYAGQVTLGAVADGNLSPHPREITEGAVEAFEELAAKVG
jgi:diacylglycerol O-acyltransferase / wax synthase